eukprot:5106554-Amphidinium_carterae.1
MGVHLIQIRRRKLNSQLGASSGNRALPPFRTSPPHSPGVVDMWSIGELHLLPDLAIDDLAHFLKMVEETDTWPTAIKEMLYLQLPKEGARDA